MNPLDTLAALLKAPMGLIRAATGKSRAELFHLLPHDTAATLYALTAVYGSTTDPAAVICAKAIEDNHHSLDTLIVIEKLAKRVKSSRKKWQLRRLLCHTKGNPKQIKKRGLTLLVELATPRTRKLGVSVSRYSDQLWSMRITGPAAIIASLYDPVKNADDPVDALHQAVTGGRSVETILRPIVTIPLDKADTVLDGTGDETVFSCSDGVTRTSCEIVGARLDEHWGFALIHPVEGPVDLVRSKRFANTKQRVLAAVENPTCAWEGCNKPADECQVHHLLPWQYGGHTTSSNLTTCCAYHNGVNDDDPAGPGTRGRLERVDGTVRRVYH